MALTQVAVTQKNRSSYSKTLLLNTKRWSDAYEDSSKTIFYYFERNDRRDKPTEYKYNGTLNAFKSLMNEDETVKYLTLPVSAWKDNDQTPPATTMTFRVDNIVLGYDTGTSSAYIWVDRGAFKTLRFKISNTIAEINSSASGSGSLAS